jgi:hypothetical protein
VICFLLSLASRCWWFLQCFVVGSPFYARPSFSLYQVCFTIKPRNRLPHFLPTLMYQSYVPSRCAFWFGGHLGVLPPMCLHSWQVIAWSSMDPYTALDEHLLIPKKANTLRIVDVLWAIFLVLMCMAAQKHQ